MGHGSGHGEMPWGLPVPQHYQPGAALRPSLGVQEFVSQQFASSFAFLLVITMLLAGTSSLVKHTPCAAT